MYDKNERPIAEMGSSGHGYIDISQLIGYKFIIGLKELSAWKALISGYME